MSTALHNSPDNEIKSFADIDRLYVGIVVSEWNCEITGSLYDGAQKTLISSGVQKENITTLKVPGSFELIAGAGLLARQGIVDAIICLGCIIKGETPHFEYIAQGVSTGIAQLNIKYDIPFIFGVLTTNDLQQAKDRAGGKYGNKGVESAITALKMAMIKKEMELDLPF